MRTERVIVSNAAPETATTLDVEVRWLREWDEPGHHRFRIGRDGVRLVADWAGLGVLKSTVDGREFEITCAAGVEPLQEAKWRAGSVRALLRHLEGRMTLHASAIALRGRAFVFLGESGAGKSTCAAHLCESLGAELVSDDLTHVEVVGSSHFVSQTEAAHWLLPDSAAALGRVSDDWKQPLSATRLAGRSTPLAALIDLSFMDSPPGIHPVRGEGAFAAINRSYVRFLVDDLGAHLRDLHLMANLASAIPVVRLNRPRSFTALGDVAACFAGYAASLSADSGARGQQP